MINFLLYLIAKFTTPAFNFVGFITIVFKKKEIRQKVFKDLAIGKDQYTNITIQFLFNNWMLKNNSKHLFGNPDETISSVFGKNKRDNTLNKFGNFWAMFLNTLDKNHVEKAIEDDEKTN